MKRRRATIWAADLRRWVPPPSDVPLLIEVSALSAALMEAAMIGEADLVATRLGRGCRCFAICVEGSVAAYGWLSMGPEWIGELGLEIRPGAGDAYLWNCLTLRAHRGAGLFRRLIGEVAAQAKKDGCSRLWIGSLEGSAESAVAGAGFEPALRLTVIELPGLRRISTAPPPSVAPELCRAAMTALGLGGPTVLRWARRRRH